MFCAPRVTIGLRLPRRRTKRYVHMLELARNSRVLLASNGNFFFGTTVDHTRPGRYRIGVLRR